MKRHGRLRPSALVRPWIVVDLVFFVKYKLTVAQTPHLLVGPLDVRSTNIKYTVQLVETLNYGSRFEKMVG
jgi:hypothetical protein